MTCESHVRRLPSGHGFWISVGTGSTGSFERSVVFWSTWSGSVETASERMATQVKTVETAIAVSSLIGTPAPMSPVWALVGM